MVLTKLEVTALRAVTSIDRRTRSGEETRLLSTSRARNGHAEAADGNHTHPNTMFSWKKPKKINHQFRTSSWVAHHLEFPECPHERWVHVALDASQKSRAMTPLTDEMGKDTGKYNLFLTALPASLGHEPQIQQNTSLPHEVQQKMFDSPPYTYPRFFCPTFA